MLERTFLDIRIYFTRDCWDFSGFHANKTRRYRRCESIVSQNFDRDTDIAYQ